MASGNKVTPDVVVAFAVAALLTILALVIDDESFGWLLAVPILSALIYTMVRLPLRTSLMWITFCAFTLENPAELPAAGMFKTPLFVIGSLLLTHLNGTTKVSALSFSGMDLFFVILGIIALRRRATGSKIDSQDRLETPLPLGRLAWLSLGGTALMWLSGLVRGGDFSVSLWQVDRVVYLPIVFFLFRAALRGPRDFESMARVLVSAATVRACLGLYVYYTVQLPPDEDGRTAPQYVTSHHDSILFAAAFILLVALVIHRAGRASKIWALIIVPLLVGGMLANNRRMVWVQVGLVLITLYVTSPMNDTKRKIRKVVWALTPVFAIYLAVGWGHTTGIFRPVKTIQSIVEPSTDQSTQTREIENYDLIYTFRQNPIIGSGYGVPYIQVQALPPMGYPLEQFIPHNSILGLWAYGGFVGFTALSLLWYAGVYFGMRAYKAAKRPEERAASLMCYASVLIYLVQCWGDMGLGSWTGVFTVAPAIALAGKICVAVGAWQPERKRASVPVAARAQVRVEAASPE
jgi:hypothetical protein